MAAKNAGAVGCEEGASLLVIEDHHALNPDVGISCNISSQRVGKLGERSESGLVCLIVGVRRGGCGEGALPAWTCDGVSIEPEEETECRLWGRW